MTTKVSINTAENPPSTRGGGAVSLGFAITVAVWIVAYICRVPMIEAPAPLTVGLMLLTVLVGGFLVGRWTGRGALSGALAGAVSGLLDVLIVLSIFGDVRRQHPEYATAAAMLMWVGGSVALNALLAGVGGALSRLVKGGQREINPLGVLAWTLSIATLALIAAGGLVTAWGAGLAVPDWPNSFGTNMFLLPLSQMQGGVFYEHAHRLMGSLVGLTSMALAIAITARDPRGWVKAFAWVIFVFVCIQGLLGGLRVTGHLTTATEVAAMRPSTTLAIVHGIFAQLVFAMMCALAAAVSRPWRVKRDPIVTYGAQTDYAASVALVLFMVVQLVLGALLRHRDMMLIVHITNSIVVTLLAVMAGMRAWGLYGEVGSMRRAGMAVMVIVFAQLILGVGALVFRQPLAIEANSVHAIMTTLHQVNGAALMAACAVLLFWTVRLVRFPAPADLQMEPAI